MGYDGKLGRGTIKLGGVWRSEWIRDRTGKIRKYGIRISAGIHGSVGHRASGDR